ncbi:MAG: hypothetical protein JWM10_2718 [Myxococcaceae bacterium]|nr:hypothetical protein [Myxococcaceae bacterium]
MWPARAAIRPIAGWAMVPPEAIASAEAEVSDDGDLEAHVMEGFAALERAQPALGRWLRSVIEPVRDDTAQALGYFLAIVVHRAFGGAFGARVRRVDDDALASVQATFEWDEELRRGDADEVLESDDLVAIGQPHLMAFVREQLEAALEPDEDGDPVDVDLEAVAGVYRAVLIEILALGQVLTSPKGERARDLLA